MEIEFIKTDVLIIGSEGAGARAAIAACENGADVVVLSKAYQGRSGATITAPGDYACDSKTLFELGITGANPSDTIDKFYEDIMIGGKYLNIPLLAERLAIDSGKRLKDLLNYGAKFTVVHQYGGHTLPRGACAGKVGKTGVNIMKALGSKAKVSGARLFQACFTIDLLFEDDIICGAITWDIKSGKLIIFEAPSVIITTGGFARIWGRTSNPEESTGDGIAMALRAGAELLDCEMVQFIPYALVKPPAAEGHIYFSIELLSLLNSYLRNSDGERFMYRYDPERLERSTRDFLSLGIASEVNQGRGCSSGGIKVDISHIPKETLEQLVENMFPKWKVGAFSLPKFGFDPYQDAMEIAPVAHYCNGGIKIDTNCCTNIKGLYAAGEVAGGVQGANRLSGCAITETQVYGAIAGKEAANHALKYRCKPLIPKYQVEEAKDLIKIFFEKQKRLDTVWSIRNKIHELADKNVGVLREATGLQDTLKSLNNLNRDILNNLRIDTEELQCNYELIASMEAINMLKVLEGVVKAALIRKETIGSHNRTDFPQKDIQNYHTILSKKGLNTIIKKQVILKSNIG
ncbi:MAG: FAD-binding protein [Bacillota bacterium]|nr:FAD-binding protein [Bacillota bacterium]